MITRFFVSDTELTDGSKVYDVRLESAEVADALVFEAENEARADRLMRALNSALDEHGYPRRDPSPIYDPAINPYA